MILPEGDLFNSHVLHAIGIGLQLVDIQHENITLDLVFVSMCNVSCVAKNKLTSIRQKLGVGSSLSGQKPELIAPVALPGLMKKRPSISNASNRCVPPHRSTSTSIWRAAINSASASAGGTMVWPCVKPIRRLPWLTILERGRLGESTSKSPLTICRSGATSRRKS